ncbi:hypothetical protein [uncultured Xanthomonas sp.]|uniref:hypothetical protein n=1 Tax=uncultured Xanthomonas sp. TaxID=152831 RepID=UPI0025F3F1F7|nr:hypothetical protein [uncultured Xanthomonas sp.]
MKTSLACFSVLLLGGCAHLEQAPLVYASKTSFGVDVSTASTENPGISMNLGYKQVDAAYVPVAVARKCNDGVAGADCSKKGYDLLVISGVAREGDSDADGTSEDARIEVAKKASTDYARALSEETLAKQAMIEADSKLKQLRDSYSAAAKRQSAYDQAKLKWASLQGAAASPGTVEEADVIAAKSAMDALAPTAEDQAILAGFAQSENDLRQNAAAVASEYASKQKASELQEAILKSANAKIARSNLGDSYSVFGSFDGTSTVNGKGSASIGLGKMFSTGVAAQRLASGISTMACYDLIKSKAPAAVAAAELEKLLQHCQ